MPCIPLETEVATKQQLIFSRSFSTPVTSAARMHEVMAIYAKRASNRLAKDSQQAKLMTCFAGTSHFNQTAASFPSVTVKLPVPTADPVLLTKAATGALEGRIVDGVPYARAGVMLTDLSPAGAAPQLPMFATAHEEKHVGSLLGDVLDRFGSGSNRSRRPFRSSPVPRAGARLAAPAPSNREPPSSTDVVRAEPARFMVP
jgi:DNA polymerase V